VFYVGFEAVDASGFACYSPYCKGCGMFFGYFFSNVYYS